MFQLLILFFGSTSVFSQLDEEIIKLSGAIFVRRFREDQQKRGKNAKEILLSE